MNEAREQQRQNRLPARILRLRQRLLQQRLIDVGEALRHFMRGLPDALGQPGGALGVFHILLEQLAPVGPQRSVEILDRGNTVQVEVLARLPHALECPHDVLLPADDVQRRQLA